MPRHLPVVAWLCGIFVYPKFYLEKELQRIRALRQHSARGTTTTKQGKARIGVLLPTFWSIWAGWLAGRRCIVYSCGYVYTICCSFRRLPPLGK
jgi:hypothetical protein